MPVVTVKVSSSAAALIEAASSAAGITISELVRQAVQAELQYAGEPLPAGARLLRVRATRHGREAVRAAAAELGLSLSEFIRLRLAAYLMAQGYGAGKVTGAAGPTPAGERGYLLFGCGHYVPAGAAADDGLALCPECEAPRNGRFVSSLEEAQREARPARTSSPEAHA
jgi:uncharacterized protein (DUF1778 family)